MIKCRRPTTELGKVRRYFNSFHWIELPCMLDTPQNHMHQQHDKFMMAAYLHNQVVFCANVFFLYKRKYFGAFYYSEHAFMKFRPKDLNKYDKPYGNNGLLRRFTHIMTSEITSIINHGEF